MKRVSLIFLLAMALIIFMSPSAKALGPDSFLIVNEPKDNFLTNQNLVVVSGETLPETTVSIMVNGVSKSKLSVGAAGIFLTQVPVKSRENVITIKAVFPSGKSETVSRRVYQTDGSSEWLELDYLIQTIKTFLILK